jgi:hypothetical protein
MNNTVKTVAIAILEALMFLLSYLVSSLCILHEFRHSYWLEKWNQAKVFGDEGIRVDFIMHGIVFSLILGTIILGGLFWPLHRYSRGNLGWQAISLVEALWFGIGLGLLLWSPLWLSGIITIQAGRSLFFKIPLVTCTISIILYIYIMCTDRKSIGRPQ